MARPIPRDAPVTNAVLPDRDVMWWATTRRGDLFRRVDLSSVALGDGAELIAKAFEVAVLRERDLLLRSQPGIHHCGGTCRIDLLEPQHDRTRYLGDLAGQRERPVQQPVVCHHF